MSDLVKSGGALRVRESTVRAPPGQANWKLAFGILAGHTCTGFVSSEQVSGYIEALREAGEAEAAEVVVKLFNGTRSEFMQGFMG